MNERFAIAIAVGSLVSIGLGVAVALGVYAPSGDSPEGADRAEPTAPSEPEPEGQVVVEEVHGEEPTPTSTLPTAGTVELPGGDAQAHYETALRALGTQLSQQGLRPRDIRSHPRGMLAWTAQTRAASARDYPEASARIGELAALASSKTPRDWMVYRLQRVEGSLGGSTSAAGAARARALWSTLERSATSPTGVRQWMRRLDALEEEVR